jgi:hypothetical protein
VLSRIDDLACAFGLLLPVFRVELSAHAYIHWGGRWLYGHHVLDGPPQRALHVLALVNNGARI